MKIGVTLGLGARAESTIAGLSARVKQLEEMGFHSVWLPMAFGFDAITALAVAGQDTSRIEIGTAVVPTFPRHPVVMAQQALTAQEALGGRFTLGIGLSHKVMVEDQLGLPYEHTARHMREYLSVLAPLLAGQAVSFQGEQFRVQTSLTLHVEPRVPLLVAALGPAMLKLAGTFADGTVTSWVGPRTFETHIIPAITRAAAAAGRPAPRIAAGLPIALTNDAAGVRERLAGQVAFYDTLPSYRAMFEREGAAGAADLAMVGDERALDAHLARLREAGVTDYIAQLIAPEPEIAKRTIGYLASRL